MAMQRFFEFFRRKNYGALWNNLFNFFHYSYQDSLIRGERITKATSSHRYFFFTRAKFDVNNGLFKENLVKHIRKRTIQTGRLFFSSFLMSKVQFIDEIYNF